MSQSGIVGKVIGVKENCLINASAPWAEIDIGAGGVLQPVAYSGLASDLSGSLPASSLPSATTAPLALLGVVDGSAASAGFVGETISNVILFANAVNVASSGVDQNVTSISLQPGDYDITSNIFVQGSVANLANVASSTSLITDLLDDQAYRAVDDTGALHSQSGLSTVVRRYSFSAPQLVYLVVSAVFTAGSVSVCGNLMARRVR